MSYKKLVKPLNKALNMEKDERIREILEKALQKLY